MKLSLSRFLGKSTAAAPTASNLGDAPPDNPPQRDVDAAIALYRQGRLDEALPAVQNLLKTFPRAMILHNLAGALYFSLGRAEDALASFDRAVLLNPDYAEAHNSRGNALYELKRFDEAAASYQRAALLKPEHFVAHFNRGNVLLDLHRSDEALASFDAALRCDPNNAQAHNNRGNALCEMKRLDEALASYDKALLLQPDDVEARFNRGNVLWELRRLDEALADYGKVLQRNPDHAEVYFNRGHTLQELNRLDAALADYDSAVRRNPAHADAFSNRGNTLLDLGREEEARASFERALAIDPDHADAKFNMALLLLGQGDYRRGWPLYEWRWESAQKGAQRRWPGRPLWLGGQSLAGKTILLHAEQGLGDTIQLVRFIPLVKALGGRVILEAPAALTALFAGLPGVDLLISAAESAPHFDLHCPLMSLPLALGVSLESIPAADGYLHPEPNKLKAWASRLADRPRPRIGLVWSGSTIHKNDLNRSLPFSAVAPLLSLDADWICLQKEVRETDRAAVAACPGLRLFGDDLTDFSQTAALVGNLDLVVTVDTSVAHLAGAMGKPCWILLPFAVDWRWMRDREDSPWYDSVRLFRQPAFGDWDAAISRLAGELTRRFQADAS
jgi:tetratricopeptide (TPR) repeat protein